jgi:hypothetical protein
MTKGLNNLLEETGLPGLAELRGLLQELLGGSRTRVCLVKEQQLNPRVPRVYRVQFETTGGTRSLIVKRLDPAIAQRNHLVITRWLPAAGLGEGGPKLLGTAAERRGQCVWHVYEDLGDWALDGVGPEPERVQAAVEWVARLHVRFAGHPLLPECRLHGGDLGTAFYNSNVRDAIRGLETLRPPRIELSADGIRLRDRLLERMYQLLDEQATRALAIEELGGHETLLHGDLWTSNTFVLPAQHGWQTRLIDWDHAGVGPVSYDLSTFLLRFPAPQRPWILDLYRAAVEPAEWHLPSNEDLNQLFETAEYARFANRIIWPAIALATDHAEWGLDELAEVEQWFETFEPILSGASESWLVNAAQG